MLDLSLIKQHCKIEPDITDEDELLLIYAGAAGRYVENYTGRKLYKTNTDPGLETYPDHLLLDDDIRTAMLLLIAHWYEHRETVQVDGKTPHTLPLAVDSLLQPHKIYRL